MTSARALILFILSIAGGFIFICNMIPQIQSEAAVEEPVTGDSPEGLAAAGQRIFMSDRAQCLTCHSLGEDPKARCPNQEGLGERAANRKPGTGAAEYLVESLYDPNAFIVPGYPRDQMRPVNKPPIALSHDEILAVIAFLNTLGGTTDAAFIQQVRQAQDPWRRGLRKPDEGAAGFKPPILAGDPMRGREVFSEQGCSQCHRLAGEGREFGPDLSSIGASQSPQYILESFLDPNAVIVRGYKQTIVFWKDSGRSSLQGTVVSWLPDKQHPAALLLGVLEAGVTQEQRIDLSEVDSVGDTIAVIKQDGGYKPLLGEYLSGDEKSGIKLAFLENGSWVERLIEPQAIDTVNPSMSPMPGFADILKPADAYNLLAYLVEQKGQP